MDGSSYYRRMCIILGNLHATTAVLEFLHLHFNDNNQRIYIICILHIANRVIKKVDQL